MIFKLTFEDGRIDWITAKGILHLLKEYDKENDLSLQDISDLQEISNEEAKTIMLTNMDYDENDPDDSEFISLFDSAIGDEFCIIGSNAWDF